MISYTLKGQWIGTTLQTSTNLGFIIINFKGSNIARVMFYDFNPDNGNTWADLIYSFDGKLLTGDLKNFTWWKNNIKLNTNEQKADKGLPNSGQVKANLDNNSFNGEWKSNVGTGGSFNLSNRFFTKNEELFKNKDFVEEINWKQFKDVVKSKSNNNYDTIYRGQSYVWPLRASFYRAGGTCLISYRKDCLTEVSRHVNSQSSHKYSLKNNDDIGALLNLAQHHGYPTPLLDWTESPYVAAFFAFEGANDTEWTSYNKVRIFEMQLNKGHISDEFSNSLLEHPLPILQIGRYQAYGNNRALPQQSVSLFTNISDIEMMIRLQGIPGKIILKKYDLDISDKKEIMNDLRYMGITAASMFPGLDGICKALKNKHFE